MTYKSTLKALYNGTDGSYASAAGRGAAAAPPPPPPPANDRGAPIFPPVKPPCSHKSTALVDKAASKCPMCHNKHHGLAKCGFTLRTGFVCQHKSDKAAKQLVALNLGGRPSKLAAGNRPSANLTRAPSAPPLPLPPHLPCQLPHLHSPIWLTRTTRRSEQRQQRLCRRKGRRISRTRCQS